MKLLKGKQSDGGDLGNLSRSRPPGLTMKSNLELNLSEFTFYPLALLSALFLSLSLSLSIVKLHFDASVGAKE